MGAEHEARSSSLTTRKYQRAKNELIVAMKNGAVASLVVIAILAGVAAGYFFGTNTATAGSSFSATWTAVCSISGVKLPPQNSSVPLQVVSVGADCEIPSNIVQFSMTLKNTSNRTVVLSGYAGPELDGAISYKILSGNTTLRLTSNEICTGTFSTAEEPPGTQLTFVTGGCQDPYLLEAIAPGIATVQFTIGWAEPPSYPSIPLTMIANLTVAKS